MASYENEKGNHEAIERVDTHSSNEDNAHRYPLEKTETHETIAAVDVDNNQAFKGDDSDGKVQWTLKKLLAAASLSMLYTGSQIPLYFVGGTLSYISADIGGADVIGWLPVANTLAIASVAPFVGYLQDLFGKRYISLFGALLLCVGCVVLGTAHSLGPALVGMAMAGGGAGIGELTGLAGLAETVPVKQRGYSLAVLTAFVLPFCPYVMYSEMFCTRGSNPTWRWGIWISLIYNGITFLGLATCYFPINHPRAAGLSTWDVMKKIDIVGGLLSIIGLTLFLVALQAGGYTHAWTSAYTLCLLLIGIALLVVFIVWEVKVARHPIIPKELFLGQRVVAPAFAVAFVAGMNFFSLLNFWPLTISNVWNPDPVQIGIRGIPVGMATAVGAIFWNALLSYWKGGAKWVLLIASGMLTAFGGSLACLNPTNSATVVTLASFAAFGLGGVIVPAATVAMIAAPDALITTCAALSLSVRAVGGSIGYSIYFSIFSKRLRTKLPVLVAGYAIKSGLPASSAEAFVGTFLTTPTKIASIPGVTLEVIDGAKLGAQWAYAEGLSLVWYTSIAFGLCAMVCSLLIPNTKKFETNRVAVDLH
ncbi:MFS drug efflux pump like protein [Zymoseptoria brevis]|uniref:MFS drug efflux pump like protein n=1 Tax=Zymoseptoria brevis TaxID=1047168 RepID=A0A0F4GIB0_9PEZI|nr:MFS drug efflux pump like protein [Zymoseptoria brevis]